MLMNGCDASMVEAIHASGFKAVLVVSGGGSSAVHRLLSHPGASRFVLDVRIPYAALAMEQFLGHAPRSACSMQTARDLAASAFEVAMRHGGRVLGISCTAALRTNRERKGTDRAFMCIKSAEGMVERELELPPGSRAEQEAILGTSLLEFIRGFVGE